METVALLKHARLSAQKGRLIINQIRGLSVSAALNFLTFNKKNAASIIKKLLESAIANAEHNAGEDIDHLVISTVYIDQATTLKRMHARAKGRGNRILKPTSHITLKISKKERK